LYGGVDDAGSDETAVNPKPQTPNPPTPNSGTNHGRLYNHDDILVSCAGKRSRKQPPRQAKMSSAMLDVATDAAPGRSATAEEEASCGGDPGTHAMHHRTDAEYNFLLSSIDESFRAVHTHCVNPTP